jgi:hypothetical protein
LIDAELRPGSYHVVGIIAVITGPPVDSINVGGFKFDTPQRISKDINDTSVGWLMAGKKVINAGGYS